MYVFYHKYEQEYEHLCLLKLQKKSSSHRDALVVSLCCSRHRQRLKFRIGISNYDMVISNLKGIAKDSDSELA